MMTEITAFFGHLGAATLIYCMWQCSDQILQCLKNGRPPLLEWGQCIYAAAVVQQKSSGSPFSGPQHDVIQQGKMLANHV